MPLRVDKSYLRGPEHVLNMFIGEMQSLDFDNEEIIKAIIERCNPDLSPFYEELIQQEKHLKEIANA